MAQANTSLTKGQTQEPDRKRTQFSAVDEAAIAVLVEEFYRTVRRDPRLGEIFERRLAGKWDEHQGKMQLFWQSVLLKNGVYKGKPVPAHLKQKELVGDDYALWLDVFRAVVSGLFEEQPAAEIIGRAERIAQSLWLASFGVAGSQPPAALTSDAHAWGGGSCLR
ncbi:hemoglobin [Roseibium hamelinense]|uniref:Hemoglobin n=1 Tax=Roseibium hamelinense TaxID=150831 RepID=A0A562T3J1_9HYPH|nr:group III truncated hemoglobin [Roseibium hamelinense]MTI43366.1 group III truncated hemoglobin [Roseibium hamelinense]TWI87566.1 hemoglobin [Roseibium hamelinense]